MISIWSVMTKVLRLRWLTPHAWGTFANYTGDLRRARSRQIPMNRTAEWRGEDLNLRPSGYETHFDRLPGNSLVDDMASELVLQLAR